MEQGRMESGTQSLRVAKQGNTSGFSRGLRVC
jgi:hypothetical protein